MAKAGNCGKNLPTYLESHTSYQFSKCIGKFCFVISIYCQGDSPPDAQPLKTPQARGWRPWLYLVLYPPWYVCRAGEEVDPLRVLLSEN